METARVYVEKRSRSRYVKGALLPVFLTLASVPWILAQVRSNPPGAASAAGAASTSGKNSCVECHTQMGDQLAAPVAAIEGDIHQRNGLSCSDCHGGDPSQDDPTAAMNPAKGFVAKPKPKDVGAFCGKCHSNADFMKKYNPALRVDQVAEYATSVHGKLSKQGDEKVAVCISCHGFHGIKPVSDPGAPVYRLNVAQTCSGCHSNGDYMRDYQIPTDQAAKYYTSVHADALLKKQDMSAPTCNNCHGNHGAAPPGVGSVANICGTCHTRQSDLFQKSPHKAPFDAAAMAGCVVCHSNHEIQHPSEALLGVGEGATCLNCHSQGDAGYEAAAGMRQGIDKLVSSIGEADQVLTRAAQAGMEVSRPQFELNDARDKLVSARVVVHAFSVAELEKEINPGLDIAGKADASGHKALGELQFRRKGLAASLIFILLAIAAIYLKTRQISSSQSV